MTFCHHLTQKRTRLERLSFCVCLNLLFGPRQSVRELGYGCESKEG